MMNLLTPQLWLCLAAMSILCYSFGITNLNWEDDPGWHMFLQLLLNPWTWYLSHCHTLPWKGWKLC